MYPIPTVKSSKTIKHDKENRGSLKNKDNLMKLLIMGNL